MADPTQMQGLASRVQPANPTNTNGVFTGGFYTPIRVDQNGNQVIQLLAGSKMTMVAEEGNYFIAVNPTPGTGIAGGATTTAFADTAPLLMLRHGDAQTGKRLFLDFILLTCTAAGANGTNFNYVMRGDIGQSRYTSGGTSITPANVNMDSQNAPGIDRLQFGAVVAAAASAQARTLAQGQLKSVIKAAGDRFLFTFGSSSPMTPDAIMNATLGNINISCPQVIIPAGGSFFLHEWAASQTAAASYELMMGFYLH